MFLKYFITPNAEQHYFTERESEQRTALFILRREKERSFYLVRATGRQEETKGPISKESVAGIEPETPVSVGEHSTPVPPITSTKL